MKKIFTLIAFIGLAFSSYAVRHCNVVIKHATLTSSGGKYLGDSSNVPFIATIVNNGPDSVKLADSIIFYIKSYDIYTHTFSVPSNAVFIQRSLKSGDSLTFYDTAAPMPRMFRWSGFASDSTGNLCLGVYALNRTSDSVATDTAAASIGCANVTYVLVHNIATLVGGVDVFPNPAHSAVNMEINLNVSGNVTLAILDITGRAVLTENKGKLDAGVHRFLINTNDFQDGIYIYRVIVNDETYTGRFSISK